MALLDIHSMNLRKRKELLGRRTLAYYANETVLVTTNQSLEIAITVKID
jgi:hypothetical protein